MKPLETAENPFSARRVRPGGIPYIFPPGQDAAMLLDRLQRNGFWGEIVGPHGSGKSALLHTLMAALSSASFSSRLVTLHDQQRRLPQGTLNDLRVAPPIVLMIDGYEQLSFWSRFSIKRFCRKRCVGLLVTAHASVGFPPLYETLVTPKTAEQVVTTLLAGRSMPFSISEVSTRLAAHNGDLRETLFELYDIFEAHRPS
jgi:hypothetical protein